MTDRTPDEKQPFLEHIIYELNGFVLGYKASFRLMQIEPLAHQFSLEVMCLHARNLLEFFTEGQMTTVDFGGTPERMAYWRSQSGDLRKKLNTQISHITWARVSDTPENRREREWKRADLQLIFDAGLEFINLLLSDASEIKPGRFLPALNVLRGVLTNLPGHNPGFILQYPLAVQMTTSDTIATGYGGPAVEVDKLW